MKQSQNKSRFISVTITMIVILMLIISEPAGAITVNVDTTKMTTFVGQDGYFYFNVTIGGNEKIPIANFTIEGLPEIPGSEEGVLLFNVSEIGTMVGGNTTKDNYLIELVDIHGWVNSSNASFGYSSNDDTAPYKGTGGYGYSFSGNGFGYGSSNPGATEYTQLAYKITVNTTGATAQKYDNVIGKINTGNGTKPFFSAITSSFTLAYAPPNITSYGPSTPPTDNEGATRSFNITVDQDVNVTWKINGIAVQINTSITEATYINENAQPGVWTVSAIATNTNGTDTQSWTWTVIEDGTISGIVTDSSTKLPISNAIVYAMNVSTGSLIGSDQTDSTGKYYISIIPGTYTLNVSASNYAWNNDTTAVVTKGELNSNCDVELTPQKVTLVLQSSEMASKTAVIGNATVFNLIATNYGTDAHFTVSNSSTSAEVKFNGTSSFSFILNGSKSKNFNVTINSTIADYYPVTITLENSTKSVSINLYATMRNVSVPTIINSNASGGNASGGAVLVNSSVSSNASVNASTLHNSTVSGNDTIVKEGSTITYGNVTDGANVAGGSLVKYSNVTGATSEVDNGATIDNSTVDNSKVDNSIIVNVTAKSNTKITGVTIDTSHAIELTSATVTANSKGDAQISGSTNAVIVTRNVNFTKIYSDIAIKDLIIDQSPDMVTTKNMSKTIDDVDNCKLTMNFSEPALVNISETGINPDGEGTDVDDSEVISKFMHIQHNISDDDVNSITIRLYYETSKSYTDGVYAYYYNKATSKWEQQTTINSGTDSGRAYVEITPTHLSTFTIMGVDKAPSTSSSKRSGRSNYWLYHGTPTPTSTEFEDTTQGQVTSPAKTEKEDMGLGIEQTQAAATPIETEDGGIPGFGAVMFIAGLLAATYIIMRKRG